MESKHIRAFFLQIGVLTYSVGVALVASLAIANVAGNTQTVTLSFAKPALDVQMRWADETGDFSKRLQMAFGLAEPIAAEYARWILEAAKRQELSPDLLAGLVHAESTFSKTATSHAGAIGPTQVRPEYWSRFCGYPNLRDPEQNIHCGAQVLAHLRERCGNDNCALKAYNVGLGSIGGPAAQRYLRKIARRLSLLEDQTVI